MLRNTARFALAVLACSTSASWAADGVKMLYGFELSEIVGDRSQDPAGGRKWRFVGKRWDRGEPPPGWRVRDHVAEHPGVDLLGHKADGIGLHVRRHSHDQLDVLKSSLRHHPLL